MNDINVKKVNKLIEDFEQIGNKAEVLEIGYKTYAVLMAEERFAENQKITYTFNSDILKKSTGPKLG